jgi:recombination protein RecA
MQRSNHRMNGATAVRSRNDNLEGEPAMTNDRTQAIDLAIGQIEKQFGRGAIMRLGEHNKLEIESIPTGSLSLDLALGIGGLPRGRITELYGPESAGKSTLAQHVIAEAQKLGGTAAYIDVEHALEPTYAKALGVRIDELLVSQPDTGEQALEICEALVRSNAVDVIIIDSVAALVPRAELEGEMGDSLPGLQARLMSQALRKLTGAIAKSKCVVIFVNQLREKIGVVFGNPEVTPGGRALKFYSSVRIEIRRIESLKQGQQVIGNRVRTRVVKNKVAPPFRVAEFDMMFTGKKSGISREGEILDVGVEYNIIKKLGAFYSYGEMRLGQGRENARAFLIDNEPLALEIEGKIREAAQAALLSPVTAPRSRPAADDDEGEDLEEEEQ